MSIVNIASIISSNSILRNPNQAAVLLILGILLIALLSSNLGEDNWSFVEDE